MNDFTFHDATPADAERIALLHVESWRTTYDHILTHAYLGEPVLSEKLAQWREWLATPVAGQRVRTLLRGDALIGFSCAFLDDDPDYGCLLENLHLRPGEQGKRLGTHLLRDAVGWIAGQRPATPLYLWVMSENHGACRYYEALGGTPTPQEPWMSSPDGKPHPVHRYCWPDAGTLAARCDERLQGVTA